MELDDLRRQWRQPEPVAPPLTSRELQALLKGRTLGLVEKMRRNARLELGVNYVLLVISLGIAVWAADLWLRLFGGLIAAVAAVCIYYFYRKLGLLRHMDDPAGDLRAHLGRMASGLRALIRFYYRLTLAMIPVSVLMMGLLVVLKPHNPLTPLKLGLIAAVLVALAGFLYLPTAHVTAKYLQRLYGQHLDRLEGQLRELDEGELPTT